MNDVIMSLNTALIYTGLLIAVVALVGGMCTMYLGGQADKRRYPDD